MNFANAAQTTLSSAALAGDAAIAVSSATLFPAAPFHILCDSELMTVTAVVGTSFTVTRGIEGTTAAAHAIGAYVTNVVTAADLNGFASGGGGGGDMLVAATNADVTGTNANTTAAYDKWTVLKATTLNAAVPWKITLPAAALSSGKRQFVGIQCDPTSTQLISLVGNAGTENIGPGTAVSRLLWAGESAILYTDGTNWFKLAGLTIPLTCGMRLSADKSGIVSGTVTKVLIDGTDFDSSGLMGDTTNNQMKIARTGKYTTCGVIAWNNISTTDASRTLVAIYKNGGSTTIAQGEMFGKVGGFPHPQFTQILTWTAADTIQLQCFQNSGNNQGISGSAAADSCFLQLAEIPNW